MINDPNQRTILITGATGQQGGSVARNLANKEFHLRAMTRHPDGKEAQDLKKMGIEIIGADLDDVSSLQRALQGVWGVFSVQDAMEAGPDHEAEQGKQLATEAHRCGVQHFVYTSVVSAQNRTGIPHFESKWQVEEHLRSLNFPSHVIIRPAFFMENLMSPWCLAENRMSLPMEGDKPLQMIAVDDIGRYGARAFEQCDEMNRAEVDIAGDTVTMKQAANLLSGALGRTITFQKTPIEDVRKQSPDMAKMFEWFNTTGYSIDIPALEKRYGIKCKTLNEWVKKVKVMV